MVVDANGEAAVVLSRGAGTMPVRGEKLLTASDLAALCEVDLKTIHNWVDRGRINHFRTPGRHLRFRAADVAEFLRAWGYTVPRELARASAKSALVIGSKDAFAHVSQALGESYVVRHATHPYDGLILAGLEPTDAYVVDVKASTGDIDVTTMLEALHRASTNAVFVALTDEATELPTFVKRLGRNDRDGLVALLAPEQPAPAVAPGFEEPRSVAAGGSRA